MAPFIPDGELPRVADREARLTHYDPLAGDVATAVTVLCRMLIRGDDWTVAVMMLLGLVASGLMVAHGINAWWPIPALAIAMTVFSLERRRATR